MCWLGESLQDFLVYNFLIFFIYLFFFCFVSSSVICFFCSPLFDDFFLGFTARMSDLMCVLKDLNEVDIADNLEEGLLSCRSNHSLFFFFQGKYHRTMVSNSLFDQNEVKEVSWRGRGEIITQDFVIELKDVPLGFYSLLLSYSLTSHHSFTVTPNGDILVEKLSFRVEKVLYIYHCLFSRETSKNLSKFSIRG